MHFIRFWSYVSAPLRFTDGDGPAFSWSRVSFLQINGHCAQIQENYISKSKSSIVLILMSIYWNEFDGIFEKSSLGITSN